LDFLIQTVAEAGAFGELVEALVREDAVSAGSHRRDKTIFCEGEVWDEVVKLKDESDFVAQQLEKIAMTIDFNAIDDDVAAVGGVESAEEVKEGALAAAGGTTECDGLALRGFEVNATKDSDGAVVETLPHFFGAENDAIGAGGFFGEGGHSKRSASTARMRMA
jgi:hypothetical protein